MNIRHDAAWSFETAQFFIGLYVEPEDTAPEDHFEFPEDIEAVREGTVEWFCALVRVYYKNESDQTFNWLLVGADSLGGCAYNSAREFYTSHRDHAPMNRNCSLMRASRGENTVICHYFPDMVTAAVHETRKQMKRVASVSMRTAT